MPAPDAPPPADSHVQGVRARMGYAALFRRFLRYGCLAWGGPVAQIAMLRHDLVEREGWVSPERFNRVLAVYQALPGPEATELCCYFGMLARGRPGAVLAGLGFVLPGFVAMLVLSSLYVRYGVSQPWVIAAFAGAQPAVAALIARAVPRIGRHALTNPWLWCVAVGSLGATLAGVHFAVPLVFGGVSAALLSRSRARWAGVATLAFVAVYAVLVWRHGVPAPIADGGPVEQRTEIAEVPRGAAAPGETRLLATGLKGGLLTFGGAYTAIPFIRADAAGPDGWMTQRQFLDGLAIGGVLPAPLIIFGTFVGYLGGGLLGACAVTVGVFLPAFAFTLIGHGVFERLVEWRPAHGFLDGVTAAVLGVIAATAIGIGVATLTTPLAWGVFLVSLGVLAWSRSGWATPAVVAGAACAGVVVGLVSGSVSA